MTFITSAALLSFLVLLFLSVECQEQFNLELVRAVNDELETFTNTALRAISFPTVQMQRDNIPIELNDIESTMQSLIYPVKLVYPEVSCISTVHYG